MTADISTGRVPVEASSTDLPDGASTGADRATEPNLYERIRARFEPLGGVELELPPREPVRPPPRFE